MVLAIFIGCGMDTSLIVATLKVSELKVSQSPLGTGETATIEAVVEYSGDKEVLIYTWTAEAGIIQGSGSRITYKAPNDPGTYSISVKVTDGATSSEKTIEIMVVQQTPEVSLILDRDAHWEAVAIEDKLAYDVRVTRVVGKRILLHYDITQDKDKFDAFFSVQIDQKTVLEEKAIGGEQPSTAVRTIGDIDVSSVINKPGRYMVNLYIRPGDRVKDGWLLNEAKLIGIEGTSDPQQ